MADKNLHTISIGMPVYNDKIFLKEALDSLLTQTYSNFIIIISDDCSNDGSKDICLEYQNRDERVKYIRQEVNIGISKNMKYLLDTADTDFFMWAANDDIWHPEFLQTVYNGLINSSNAISAFTPYRFVDQFSKLLIEPPARYTDYSGNLPKIRLKKLIYKFDDGFGYGLFRRNEISNVTFPIWWWVNRKCAYNNIYPSLCYYLTKGDYVLCGNEPMWFNRLKNEDKINHKVPFPNSYIRGTFAYFLRKFNLVWASFNSIIKASGSINLCIEIFPLIFFEWAIKPSYFFLISQTKKFSKKEINFF